MADYKRSSNYTSEEINLLLEEVEEHKSVLENKMTDRVNVELKNETWKAIANKYNSRNLNGYRSADCLKNKYKNLKKKAKNNFKSDKREIYKTGGGCKAKSECTDTDNKILEICDAEQMLGLETIYDDDVIEEPIQPRGKPILEEHDEKENDLSCSTSKSPWKKLTPSNMKRKISIVLQTDNKKPKMDDWNVLADRKLGKVEMEMQFLQQQIDQSAKEHELRMKKLELEIEILKKN